MDIGSLNRRVTVQQRSTALDAFGQALNTWLDVVTVWAAISASGGNEKLHTLQVNEEVSQRVTVRYQPAFPDSTTIDGWRIKFGTRLLNIQYAINLNERNRTMQFYCSEGLNDGS